MREQPEEVRVPVFFKCIYRFASDRRLALISQIPKQVPGDLAARFRALEE